MRKTIVKRINEAKTKQRKGQEEYIKISKDGDMRELLGGTIMTGSMERRGWKLQRKAGWRMRDSGTHHTWTKPHRSAGFTVQQNMSSVSTRSLHQQRWHKAYAFQARSTNTCLLPAYSSNRHSEREHPPPFHVLLSTESCQEHRFWFTVEDSNTGAIPLDHVGLTMP